MTTGLYNSTLLRSKASTTKLFVLLVICLVALQYFVNLMMYYRTNTAIYTIVNSYLEKMQVDEWENRTRSNQSFTNGKPLCPMIPPGLLGRLKVNMAIPAWADIEDANSNLLPGGRFKPSNCTARDKVAIIIPYRDREMHLKLFLQNIHPFLQRQLHDYGIYVVELVPNVRFNRAMLMNIGFIEAQKIYDYQCFVFHDVDLLPEDDRNMYTCPPMPRHMSPAIDKLKYRLPYRQIFGGVSAMSKEQFEAVNGFSNIFFGWGGEDDDMYKRILYSNMTISRYSVDVARYKMLQHKKEQGNPTRYKLLMTTKMRQKTDGLNSLRYKVRKIEHRKLYTRILVGINQTEILNNEKIHLLAWKYSPTNKSKVNVVAKVNAQYNNPHVKIVTPFPPGQVENVSPIGVANKKSNVHAQTVTESSPVTQAGTQYVTQQATSQHSSNSKVKYVAQDTNNQSNSLPSVPVIRLPNMPGKDSSY